MLSIIFSIILLRTCYGNLAVHHDLGLVIPDGTTFFPMSAESKLYKLNFPKLYNESKLVLSTTQEITTLVEQTPLFRREYMMKLSPIYDLSKDALSYITIITILAKNIMSFEDIELKPIDLPEYDKNIVLSTQFLAPKLDLSDITPLIVEIKTNQIGFVPSEAKAREKRKFEKILENFTFVTLKLKELKDELTILNQILKAFRHNDLDLLNSKTFTSTLSMYFTSDFEILNVQKFWYDEGIYQASISILEVNNYTQFKTYHPLQYFNHRIQNKLYSTLDSDTLDNNTNSDLFEIQCSKKYFCQPIKTGCAKALDTDDITNIFRFCSIKYSDNPYDIILDSGIVINSPYFNNDTKNYLTEIQVYNISSYPVYIQQKSCYKDTFKGDKQFCFPGPRKISYSRFAEHIIYKILKPLWHSKILDNLSDSSLIITFILFTLFLVTSICSCKLGTKFVLHRVRTIRQSKADARNPKNHPMTKTNINPDRKIHSKILKKQATEMKGLYSSLPTNQI